MDGIRAASSAALHFPRSPNLFQRALRSWDEIIPYNATHAISIDLPFEEEALRNAVHGALTSTGFSCTRNSISLRKGHAEGELIEQLRSTFEEELNQRFHPAPDAVPFRFFWLPAPEGGFVLGLTYHHVIASADCVCWMFETLVSLYRGEEDALTTPGIPHRAAPYSRMFFREWKRFPRWFAGIPRFLKQIKRQARLSGKHEKGAQCRIHACPLSPSQKDWIHAKAQETGATVNDVLMGLLLLSIGKELPHRFSQGRRNELAIGSIINIRGHFGPAHERNFGVYLALFSVSHPLSSLDSPEDLFRRIQKQTAEVKEGRLYLRNLFLVGFGTFFRRFLHEEQRAQVNQKNFPLAAGITNFFVDRFQGRLRDLPISHYWRAVSVSPATPMVVSVTTFRDETCLMFIRNESLYSASETESVISRITAMMAEEKRPAVSEH